MLTAVIAAICVSLILLLIRLILGATVFDRLLAANIIGTNIVVLIVLLAVAKDTESYIDIALIYAFLNFVGTVGFLRFYQQKNEK
jgi:multicomponent Na+:H+ antiporter subunit F